MNRIRATVRPAHTGDREALVAFRRDLWPDGPEAEHRAELDAYFAGKARESLTVLVAVDPASTPIGFCELSIHPYAEGCSSERVGYLEGWYVLPDARRQGVGRALVDAALDWARGQGLTEFASDTAADNTLSAAAHRALGFEDVGLIRCFRLDL